MELDVSVALSTEVRFQDGSVDRERDPESASLRDLDARRRAAAPLLADVSAGLAVAAYARVRESARPLRRMQLARRRAAETGRRLANGGRARASRHTDFARRPPRPSEPPPSLRAVSRARASRERIAERVPTGASLVEMEAPARDPAAGWLIPRSKRRLHSDQARPGGTTTSERTRMLVGALYVCEGRRWKSGG
jgi:hypothetical protein